MISVGKSEIRLVHVTTVPLSLPFFKGHFSFLRQHGFNVTAVSSPGPAADQFSESTQIPVLAVPMERKISPWRDVVALYRLWRLFRLLKPDIVHAHTPKAGLLGTLGARLAGVRIVYLSVFGLPQMTRAGFSRKLLNLTSRISCRIADRVWTDSLSIRQYLAAAGLCPLRKSFVLGQGSVAGVDAEGTFSPALQGESVRAVLRARYGIPPLALVLGFVGRIVGDKGMHELAEAWRILRDEDQHLHLLVVGDFEKEDPVQEADETLFRTDPRVHLTGRISEVAPFYAAMDIYVMPSYREGFGITNIEAAAMGLPVVSTKIPGCTDSVLDGLTGTLVPPKDAGALATALRQYVADPVLRELHGKAGRERALNDFVPRRIFEGLLSEYKHIRSST